MRNENEISCSEWRSIVKDETSRIVVEDRQKNATRAVILIWAAAGTAIVSFALSSWSGAIIVVAKVIMATVFAEKS